MSGKYKIRNQDSLYFITATVVHWIKVFTNSNYAQIVIDSLKYCQNEKGLESYAWCLMPNHLHMIVGRARKEKIQDIVRDFKKYTPVHICRALESGDNDKWLLKYFKNTADLSSKHIKYEFWINDYHPIELNYNSIMEQKLEYIHNYPVKRTAG